MKRTFSGEWRYALFLLILLVLSAVACFSVLQYLDVALRRGDSVQAIRVITLMLMALTVGFLFLAGGFGLWAVRSTAEVESRRRVGRFVDDMTYLSDGLVALDNRGRFAGANPAARALFPREPGSRDGLADLFPLLTRDNTALMLDRSRPHELVKDLRHKGVLRTFRLRSQPSEDMTLVLFSDVTEEKAGERRNRQTASLHLIGRMAAAVAHDFNNILCAVSGHAALLGREAVTPDARRASLDAIQRESQRGAELAAHLMELSRVNPAGSYARDVETPARRAADLLRMTLTDQVEVQCHARPGVPAVPMPEVQLEQLILHLGLQAADEGRGRAPLRIESGPPASQEPFDIPPEFGAVLMLGRAGPDGWSRLGEPLPWTERLSGEEGVIVSVARSILEEVGGRLDLFVTSDGSRHYRVGLPPAPAMDAPEESAEVDEVWLRAARDWHVLVGIAPAGRAALLAERLRALPLHLQAVDSMVSVLAAMERDERLDGMVLDLELLGGEAGAGVLLRAVRKLRPDTGIVIAGDATAELTEECQQAAFCSSEAGAADVLSALYASREKVRRANRSTIADYEYGPFVDHDPHRYRPTDSRDADPSNPASEPRGG